MIDRLVVQSLVEFINSYRISAAFNNLVWIGLGGETTSELDSGRFGTTLNPIVT